MTSREVRRRLRLQLMADCAAALVMGGLAAMAAIAIAKVLP